MRAGLLAGAIAAIVAVLVSLPLHSPVDSAFNSATVAIAVLVLGAVSGLLWSRFSERLLWYVGAMAGLFVAVVVIAFIGNSFLDRFVSFVVPLAAISIAITAVLTPLVAGYFDRANSGERGLGLMGWSPVAAAVIALALGFGLVTQGDAESGELALPPPPTAAPATAVPPTMAPVDTPAPAVTPTVASTRRADTQRAAAPTNTPAPTDEPVSTAASGGSEEAGQGFIIGEGSKITFTVEEELGRAPVRFDAVITSTGLSGTANLDGQPSVVTLNLHSLESDQQYRDRYIQTRLFPDTPEAIVTVDQLPDLPQSFLDEEETTGQLNGSLQIGETITPLVFDVTARKDGNTLNILGLTTFTWEQLGLPKPTARSVVYLADEVRVQVLLIATAP